MLLVSAKIGFSMYSTSGPQACRMRSASKPTTTAISLIPEARFDHGDCRSKARPVHVARHPKNQMNLGKINACFLWSMHIDRVLLIKHRPADSVPIEPSPKITLL